MAGHSKFANIKHRKNAQDSKRAKEFTKLTKEIMVAAGMGQPDPDFNPRLRNSLIAARKAGVPKDRIETAVKKGAGEIEGEHYEEIRYEGYAPGGIAIIVDTLTDNKNRAVAEVRSIFTKNGGSLAETGSVSFMFERVGLIEYEAKVANEEEMFEAAAEAGAEDVVTEGEIHEVLCAPDDLNTVRDALVAKYEDAESVRLAWKAKDPVDVDLETAQKLMKLVEALEDCDDVQHVTGNFNIPDDVYKQLEAE